MKSKILLFLTGFVQVFFVAINTYFLVKEFLYGVIVASFTISMVWSFNIKKIAFGTLADRIIYASGATLGSVFGLYSSKHIILFLNF